MVRDLKRFITRSLVGVSDRDDPGSDDETAEESYDATWIVAALDTSQLAAFNTSEGRQPWFTF